MNPQYPVYIVSKGRWESRLTVKALDHCQVPYHIVIEPQEYEQYAAVIDPACILVLPFSNLGLGSIPARNWIWEHSIAAGAARHWILDDNIRDFYRLTNNIKYRMRTGTHFAVVEQFIHRYTNIALAGFQYEKFIKRKWQCLPLTFNSRVYSCILINNALPYRWRGRYNEDTDISLRALKDGWCTVEFNTFLADKVATMTMAGGNTDSLYQQNGRLLMALSLQKQHPDVVQVVRKWGRWQHQVNYRPFASNQLQCAPGAEIPEGSQEFDMEIHTPSAG